MKNNNFLTIKELKNAIKINCVENVSASVLLATPFSFVARFAHYALTFIPSENNLSSMWRAESTDGWRYDAIRFSEENPNEFAALFRNLHHFLGQLKASKSSKSVEAAYLHREVSAIVAIDQTGLEDGLEDCRLYTFPDDSKRTLYLLAIGKVGSKDADMEYCKNLALSISTSGGQ